MPPANPQPNNNQNNNLTYERFIEQLKTQDEIKGSTVANMIAAAFWFSGPNRNPNDPIERKKITETAGKLVRQEAFKNLMKDPETVNLARQGKTTDLIALLADKQTAIDADDRRYEHENTPAQIQKDNRFLQEATICNAYYYSEWERKNRDGNAVGKSPAEIRKMTKRHQEMMKKLDAARAMTQDGKRVPGRTAKELIQSIKDYLEAGTGVPGGLDNEPVPCFQETMTVLKHLMPEDEFKQYCYSISEQHPDWKQKMEIAPESFTQKRMNHKEATAGELLRRYKVELQRNFSEETCAKVVAIEELSKGNRNARIDLNEFKAKTEQNLAKGSAFRKMMQTGTERERLQALAADGKIGEFRKTSGWYMYDHVVKTAQGHINRSTQALLSRGVDNYHRTTHMANILAARQIAMEAGAGTKISNGSFLDRMGEIMNDPAFQEMADRYNKDPNYRKRLDATLTKNNAGAGLEAEYKTIKERVKRTEERQRENQQVINPQQNVANREENQRENQNPVQQNLRQNQQQQQVQQQQQQVQENQERQQQVQPQQPQATQPKFRLFSGEALYQGAANLSPTLTPSEPQPEEPVLKM